MSITLSFNLVTVVAIVVCIPLGGFLAFYGLLIGSGMGIAEGYVKGWALALVGGGLVLFGLWRLIISLAHVFGLGS